MRTSLKLLLVCLVLLLGSCSDPMELAHCDDTEVKLIPSPDGKLVIVIYNSSCSAGTGLQTYAAVEHAAVSLSRPHHPDVCFLVTPAFRSHRLPAHLLD